VYVVKMGDRPALMAEWRCPLSGKVRRKSTGETHRRKAERVANEVEKELNEGGSAGRRMLWSEFREAYEAGKADRWSNGTKARTRSVLDYVERVISPRFVDAFDSAAVARFDAQMVKDGQAPTSRGIALRHLRAALNWAHRRQMLARMPLIEMPCGSSEAGGRAITLEEAERMVAAVPKLLSKIRGTIAQDAPSLVHFLWTLWKSGLRVGEAHSLSWTHGTGICIDSSGKFPLFEIDETRSKNKKRQRFPVSPESWEHFDATPEAERSGYVSNPTIGGNRVSYQSAVNLVARLGKLAGVVVGQDHSGKPTTATAHDFRRAFATRWAARVPMAVLQSMMRHASPNTTMRYYADQGGDPIASAIWSASRMAETSTNAPTIEQNEARAV
jgi:integrase